ncbi:hypothetical protein [Chondromyces apiculatus]|uniref:Uncharacterized protein n=1 Tax=Chondromyces apiculatus DSM 436 TaxID=1192034 RepID=A0A017SZZ4_9BACT|nr:hypothetical protein [Chondromyces apiculatus]EYF01891.1 Hypothetical protein CAP_7659 [Chondromyces apiculatus DSM 436]
MRAALAPLPEVAADPLVPMVALFPDAPKGNPTLSKASGKIVGGHDALGSVRDALELVELQAALGRSRRQR